MGQEERRNYLLGKVLFETYRGQIEKEFQYHPDKETILEKLEADKFTTQDVDRWFGEAAYYSGLHWNKRFKQLALQAEQEGVRSVSFKQVRKPNGKENKPREIAGEDRSGDGCESGGNQREG